MGSTRGREVWRERAFCVLGEGPPTGRNSSLSSQGTSADGIPQWGTSQQLDAKWLLTRNIWGFLAWVPRVLQGVTLRLESVGGPQVLGTPSDLTPVPRSSQGFLHLKFARTRENQFVLGQHSGPFPSVPALVLHYSSRPLPVQGAEHLALLYPLVSQTP